MAYTHHAYGGIVQTGPQVQGPPGGEFDMVDFINHDAFVDAPETQDGAAEPAGGEVQLHQVDPFQEDVHVLDYSASEAQGLEQGATNEPARGEDSQEQSQQVNTAEEDVQMSNGSTPAPYDFDQPSPVFEDHAVQNQDRAVQTFDTEQTTPGYYGQKTPDYNNQTPESLDKSDSASDPDSSQVSSVHDAHASQAPIKKQEKPTSDEDAGEPRHPIKRTRYNPADEPQEKIDIAKDAGRSDYTAAYQAALKPKSTTSSQALSSQPTFLALSCGHTRGAKTPHPTPPMKSSRSHIAAPRPEPTFDDHDPSKSTPLHLRRHEKFHSRVALLKPDLELAPHRYWIAVLNPSIKAQNASKEEHFIWFKANRLTTIETVEKVYGGVSATTGFGFLVGGWRCGSGERLEEWDVFGDRLVVLRVVEEAGLEWDGVEVTRGLVPEPVEVIELD